MKKVLFFCVLPFLGGLLILIAIIAGIFDIIDFRLGNISRNFERWCFDDPTII